MCTRTNWAWLNGCMLQPSMEGQGLAQRLQPAGATSALSLINLSLSLSCARQLRRLMSARSDPLPVPASSPACISRPPSTRAATSNHNNTSNVVSLSTRFKAQPIKGWRDERSVFPLPGSNHASISPGPVVKKHGDWCNTGTNNQQRSQLGGLDVTILKPYNPTRGHPREHGVVVAVGSLSRKGEDIGIAGPSWHLEIRVLLLRTARGRGRGRDKNRCLRLCTRHKVSAAAGPPWKREQASCTLSLPCLIPRGGALHTCYSCMCTICCMPQHESGADVSVCAFTYSCWQFELMVEELVPMFIPISRCLCVLRTACV